MRLPQLSCAFILLVTLFYSSISFSQAKVGPSVGAMALIGSGKMGNTTDVLSLNMIHTPIALFGGFNMKKFRLGLNYEYNMVGQTDDPSALGNQNIGGKGSSAGVRMGFYNGKHSVDLIYRVMDKYTLDKPTLAGNVAEYEGKMGFSVQYYRQIKKKFGFVIDYTSSEMKSSEANSDDIKWDRISLGVVFSNFTGK